MVFKDATTHEITRDSTGHPCCRTNHPLGMLKRHAFDSSGNNILASSPQAGCFTDFRARDERHNKNQVKSNAPYSIKTTRFLFFFLSQQMATTAVKKRTLLYDRNAISTHSRSAGMDNYGPLRRTSHDKDVSYDKHPQSSQPTLCTLSRGGSPTDGYSPSVGGRSYRVDITTSKVA